MSKIEPSFAKATEGRQRKREMNRIEQLLKKLCPDGVEYKPLGELCRIRNGSDYKHLSPGRIPVYGSGGVMTYVDKAVYEKPSVLIPRKGSIEKLYYVESPFWTVDTLFYTEIDTAVVVPKFLYYLLQKEHLEQYNTAGGVPSLTQGVLNKVVLPLPPIEIQREVVEVLDKFALLEAELEAELAKRKKQYEHYRRALLAGSRNEELGIRNGDGDSAANWPRVDFCEHCRILRGEYITKKDATPGPIPVILGGQEPAYYIDRSNHTGKAIVISRSGASAGFVSYWDEPIFATDGFIIETDESLSIRFVYHWLKSEQIALNNMKKGGGVPHITGENLKSLKIPLPPLEEQRKVVSILDRFDSLCNSLSEGLPAEIERRKKQYVYYRDKLLAFPKKGAA